MIWYVNTEHSLGSLLTGIYIGTLAFLKIPLLTLILYVLFLNYFNVYKSIKKIMIWLGRQACKYLTFSVLQCFH